MGTFPKSDQHQNGRPALRNIVAGCTVVIFVGVAGVLGGTHLLGWALLDTIRKHENDLGGLQVDGQEFWMWQFPVDQFYASFFAHRDGRHDIHYVLIDEDSSRWVDPRWQVDTREKKIRVFEGDTLVAIYDWENATASLMIMNSRRILHRETTSDFSEYGVTSPIQQRIARTSLTR